MKDTKTFGTLVGEEINSDADFRDEWESTALARLVAAQLIRYRAENKLSQAKLAAKLGVKQPFVARLEAGEQNPQIETLVKISRALRIEFMIDIAPAKKARKLVTKSVVEKHAVVDRDGVSVLVAAG